MVLTLARSHLYSSLTLPSFEFTSVGFVSLSSHKELCNICCVNTTTWKVRTEQIRKTDSHSLQIYITFWPAKCTVQKISDTLFFWLHRKLFSCLRAGWCSQSWACCSSVSARCPINTSFITHSLSKPFIIQTWITFKTSEMWSKASWNYHKPSNKPELIEFLLEEWHTVTQEQHEELVESMPIQMKELLHQILISEHFHSSNIGIVLLKINYDLDLISWYFMFLLL